MTIDRQSLIRNYYENHRDELLHFVGSRLGGISSAEDVVQDVFVRLLTTDKLISEVTLPALVYTIARRLVIDLRRRHFFRCEFEQYFAAVASMESSGETVIYGRDLFRRVEHCISCLPEKCRVVYSLHLFQGMKVGEISKQLGEGYKSVEQRLGLARKEVRRRLAAG